MTTDICTNFSLMDTDRKTANAVGGKTARACDSCLRKRARWYCAADDAFLCQGCDSMVHSANQLASRHERVRLGTASSKVHLSESKTLENNTAPAWQCGFTRKARTPRHPKRVQKDKERSIINAPSLVPEMGNEDHMFEETEAQLLYRVPVFDPFDAELCNASNESENVMIDYGVNNLYPQKESDELSDLNNLPVLLPSDMDLAEFAVDVESLLGGFDEESCGIKGLGLIDCKDESEILGDCYQESRVKVEDEEVKAALIDCHFDPDQLDMSKETLDWNFSYESPVTGEDELEDKVVPVYEMAETVEEDGKEINQKKKLLRLNYEAVIVAWDNHGCPWTSGMRPNIINPNDYWLDIMGASAPGAEQAYGGSEFGIMGGSDGGREARVSRYREKRRTRLFSKKIRYEVRKLNAEKRPRIKGRFVKRTSFAGESSYLHP